MASDATTLNAQAREPEGSRANRRLRREGRIPAVLYGGGGEPQHLSIDARELRTALQAKGAVLELAVGGDKTPAMVKDQQRDPVRGDAWHIDFLRVDLKQAIQTTATLELTGVEDAPGTSEGGVLEQQLRDIQIEALPGDVPEVVNHDVSTLSVGDTVHVSDLTMPSGVTILDDPEIVVASITIPRIELEPEVETETELVGEGEEGAEGEGEGDAEGGEGEGSDAGGDGESSSDE
jgi:large subunit ribosomal protein L25